MPYVSQRAYESMPLRTVDLNEVHGDPYADELGNGAPVYEAWALEGDRASSVGGVDFSYEPMKLIGDVEKPSLASSSTRGIAGRHGPRHTFHTPGGRPSSNELWRFRARGCQDCWAALFFVAFVVVTLLWGAAQIWQLELSDYDLAVISGEVNLDGPMQYGSDAFPSGKTGPLRHAAALRAGMGALWERQNALLHRNQTASHPRNRLSISSALGMLIGLGLGVTTTVLIAYLGLLVISLYPRQLIFVQAVFCSVFFAISAGVALAQGSPLGALVGTVFTFMPLLWIYLIQDRIPFTATMLCATVAVLRRHKSLFVISFASVLVCWSVLIVFTLCVLPSVLRLSAGWVAGKDIVYPFVVAFVFFWVQEVLNALVHVTVCGVVATWYFAGEECMPEYPVKMSFQRAVTTSFGSVCFGSLVTAIVSFIHFLIDCVRSGNDQDSFLMCLMDCLVGCIEDLVRYFNQYAFVHVAIYGCGYVEAAKETWALVQQCVFSAVFNDCLASQVVAIMTLISAVFVAALTAIATWSAAAAMLMFVMTWVVCSIFYTPIASCVTTIFVCFAEVPVGLQLSFPELYDALVDADSGYTARRGDNGGNSYGTYAI